MSVLIRPHGGELKDLYLDPSEARVEMEKARDYRSWDLSRRQLCDIELLLNGGFSPLEGFMGKADYDGVVQGMRLADGTLWPIPITLDVSEAFGADTAPGECIALRDAEGVLIAVLEVSDVWQPDKTREVEQVLGNADPAHPLAAAYLLNVAGPVYLGGRLKGIEAPIHYDFSHLRDTPRELRHKLEKWGWKNVVAFHTTEPMHRADQEMTFRAAQQAEANLLIQPAVGMAEPGDIHHYTRVRCYQHVLNHYPAQTTALSLLPLAERTAGPREALWHAIVRKNHGCSHFILGPNHMVGNGGDGSATRMLVDEFRDELEIALIPCPELVYVKERAEYRPVTEVTAADTVLTIPANEIRRRLQEGLEVPEWFSYPQVVTELRKARPPRHKQGLTIFFTGLSGAGKSTLANALLVKLLELGNRPVTLLDGDIVRKHLSSELGFSREHRDLNILRIGFVASEITKNGGIAICAPIAPYMATRAAIRNMIREHGGFVEIYVATPLDVCEQRDRKGLYARARAGLIKEFTGVSDPYEVPKAPELTIDTRACTPDEAAQGIILKLERLGYIK